MKDLQEFIGSGILELYVSGSATPQEMLEVEQMAATYPQVKEELSAIRAALENYVLQNQVRPASTVKPMLMATIDYIERLTNGEPFASPPELTNSSKLSDYAEWLNRPDMKPAEAFDEIYAKLLSHTEKITTAIVWIKEMAPQEVHDDEFEKFLIAEGSCDIDIEGEVHSLVPGDVLIIPLHKKHFVKVTSKIPCKVLLQRVAA
jgi:mannose-6-phosphate isomerase-like protein (cupin superfamily)